MKHCKIVQRAAFTLSSESPTAEVHTVCCIVQNKNYANVQKGLILFGVLTASGKNLLKKLAGSKADAPEASCRWYKRTIA